MSSGLMILPIVIGLVVLVALVGVLWWASTRANRRAIPPPAVPLRDALAPKPDPWTQAMAEAS